MISDNAIGPHHSFYQLNLNIFAGICTDCQFKEGGYPLFFLGFCHQERKAAFARRADQDIIFQLLFSCYRDAEQPMKKNGIVFKSS
jgi:hypothetical protein